MLMANAAALDFSVEVVQKDSATWLPVDGGMKGVIGGYQNLKAVWTPCEQTKCKTYITNDYLYFISRGKLKPNTAYTLIYWGYESFNDVWPYATCAAQGTTGANGYLTLKSAANIVKWSEFINDGLNQKFWLITSSDVNCATNKMTAWHPADYLFDMQAI